MSIGKSPNKNQKCGLLDGLNIQDAFDIPDGSFQRLRFNILADLVEELFNTQFKKEVSKTVVSFLTLSKIAKNPELLANTDITWNYPTLAKSQVRF